jgi:hypothetical protein
VAPLSHAGRIPPRATVTLTARVMLSG